MLVREMTQAERDQHDRLVRMYADQDELYRGSLVRIRYEWYEPIVALREEMIKIGDFSRIDSFVKLEGGNGIKIGRYVHIASFAHINIGGGTTILEDGSAVASGGRLISGSNSPDMPSMSACAPRDQQRIDRSIVTLKRNATVCAGAVVLPGVTLHQGAVLAANSVATKDIPPFEIWAGAPARFLRFSFQKGAIREVPKP